MNLMKFLQMSKRVILFLAVNALVLFTIDIICILLRLPQRIGPGNYTTLLLFCAAVGMGGSFISLMLSRAMAKWMQGVQVIDPNTTDPDERALVQIVYRLARAAGLSTMPEVGVYNSPEINAFATGPSQSQALVACSTGLLNRMRSAEIEGVLGHELTHVINGDMVTMTLIQGVVNTVAMFLAWALAIALSQGSRDDRDRGGNFFLQWILADVFRTVFMLLGLVVVMWFSRWREFRADAGGARLAGRDKMIGALRALEAAHEQNADMVGEQQPAFAALKISGKTPKLLALFADHPPLEERIRRLEQMK